MMIKTQQIMEQRIMLTALLALKILDESLEKEGSEMLQDLIKECTKATNCFSDREVQEELNRLYKLVIKC